MANQLFGTHIVPACKYCEKALRMLPSTNQVLCSKYGVVAPNYSCRHFVYDPLWRIPPRPRPLQNFSKSDFDIEP